MVYFFLFVKKKFSGAKSKLLKKNLKKTSFYSLKMAPLFILPPISKLFYKFIAQHL